MFPHHLNIYGDRGNILTLLYRAKKRGIECQVVEINSRQDAIPDDVNLIFGGGGQDKQQEYVSEELQFFKEKLHKLIFEKKVPALTICGTYQLFGRYFKTAEGREIKGISIFDMVTVASTKRKIGNVVVRVQETFYKSYSSNSSYRSDLLVGFENHSGNTFLNPNVETRYCASNDENRQKMLGVGGDSRISVGETHNSASLQKNINIPLGTVIKGFGNNGKDKTEGAVVANCLGTYLHGPLLPKNPQLADWLISVGVSHGKPLQPMDDSLELTTRENVIKSVL